MKPTDDLIKTIEEYDENFDMGKERDYQRIKSELQGRLDILEDEHLWLKLNYDVFDDLYCETEKVWRDRLEQITQEIQKIKEVLK